MYDPNGVAYHRMNNFYKYMNPFGFKRIVEGMQSQVKQLKRDKNHHQPKL
jgi:hypothetical protein